MIKLVNADAADKEKTVLPNSGKIDRSIPTIAPTKALTNTNNRNWVLFSFSPCI